MQYNRFGTDSQLLISGLGLTNLHAVDIAPELPRRDAALLTGARAEDLVPGVGRDGGIGGGKGERGRGRDALVAATNAEAR